MLLSSRPQRGRDQVLSFEDNRKSLKKRKPPAKSRGGKITANRHTQSWEQEGRVITIDSPSDPGQQQNA
jgi:hypothetical protein